MSAAVPALVPPHAEPADSVLPLWRFIPRFVRNPLNALPRQIYTDRFVLRDGPRRTAWISAPDLIEKVLLADTTSVAKSAMERRALGHALGDGILTSDGAAWRWQRRTVAPLFRHSDLLALVPTMVAAAEEQVAAWLGHPGPVRHAIDRDMDGTTFKIISRTMFAGAADAESAQIQAAGSEFLGHITWELAAAILGLPTWVWHPGKAAIARSTTSMRAAVGAILARRRAEVTVGEDIIARLIRAKNPDTGTPMSDAQIIDNLLTFLAAGHETTAKALTWALYLLARSDGWQDRVAAEVERVAGAAMLTAAHLDQLEITRQVVKETMRLYPPAPVITRVATSSIELDARTITPGTAIIIPIYAVHRHRALWSDPDVFDPARFSPAREATYARAQFMPFGAGPRICIGMSFAMIEATLLLATFVRAARFQWDGVHKPEPLSRVTLRPRNGMPLIVSMRQKRI
jgi:cytochrome P450